MNYKFKLKSGNIIRVFYNDLLKDEENNKFGIVSWGFIDKKTDRYHEINKKVHKDANGDLFFMYRKEKVLFKDFLAYTPEELVKRIKLGDKTVSSEELCCTLMRYGIDSIRVLQRKKPMDVFNIGGVRVSLDVTSNLDDKSTWNMIEYKFSEYDIFKLSDNYKIGLVPASEKDKEIYSSRDYYISDLIGLLCNRKDDYEVKVNKVA